ncbi:DUF2182 domain-containing protein [Aquibaculum sediminis]|uniref:DUF2182 domain-containing protein n=1 Tax=Aquibaculum sediminis TaxID=3231907 RepID=UPI003451D094
MQREGGILRTSSPATLAGLLAAILVAWGLVVWPAMTMHTGSMHSGLVHLMMPGTAVWTPTNVAAVFVMWSVMMAAMMLPGAVPMVLLYRQLVARRQPEVARRRSILFTGAYLVAWAGYSIAATGMQWGLQAGLVLSPMGVLTSPWVAATLLLTAGIYQLTGFKDACLTKCRSPFGFLMSAWRDGDRGALLMGLLHGSWCIGCCWALMVLAFVGGTMNLAWMALLTLLVTAEKVAPFGATISRFTGILLIGGAVYFALLAI